MILDKILDVVRWPKYRRYMILGRAGDASLWTRKKWDHLATLLERMFSRISSPPSIHVGMIHEVSGEDIRFDDLQWNTQSFEKWCAGHPSNGIRDRSQFVSASVFCPGLGECERRHWLPSVFVDVSGKTDVQPYFAAWDQQCHIVVRESFFSQNAELVEQCIVEVAAVANAVMVLYAETRWIYALDQFESLQADFDYIGILETPLPDLKRMKGHWAIWRGFSGAV